VDPAAFERSSPLDYFSEVYGFNRVIADLIHSLAHNGSGSRRVDLVVDARSLDASKLGPGMAPRGYRLYDRERWLAT
jgi:hypothetical protein